MSANTQNYLIQQLHLTGRYYYVVFTEGKSPNKRLSGEGDLDHDGITNAEEYEALLSEGGSIDDFVEVAMYRQGAGALPGASGLATAALTTFMALAGLFLRNRVRK